MAINYRLVGSSTGSGSTSAGTVTAGSTLVYCTTSDPGATLNSVSGGGTYTQQGGTHTTNIGSKIYAFVAPNVAGGGSVSATPSWTGTPFATGWLVEVTGADPASLDIAVGVSAKASPYLQATGTLAQAAEAVIAFVANDNGSSVDYTATSPAGLTIFGENNDTVNWWTSAVAGVVVSSTASISPTFTLSAGTNVAMIVLSFKEAGAGTTPAISSTSSASPPNGSSLTITGTDFGASQGAGSVTIGGVVQQVTSWANTSITVLVARGTNKYGSAVNVVVTDNALASSSPYALTGLTPQSGWSYVDITTPNTSVGARISTTPDLVSGDQVAYNNVGGLVSVAADATFSVGTSVKSFDFEVWSSPEGWGFAAAEYLFASETTSKGLYSSRSTRSQKRRGSTLYLLDPSNWGQVPLLVGKWFADEMPTGSVAGGTHPSTGALSAQSATVAGTATHLTLHPTTGALSAQAATVAGTATHRLLHTTTGALSSQAATIAGTAAHQHAATGALSAQAATVAGTAAHMTLHATTGALSAQAATVAGTAARQHAATGALSAQAATVAGTAAHAAVHASAGALSAQAATVTGAALHPHTTTGALSAQAAAISGAALHPHTTTGALSAQAAAISGVADHIVPGSTHSTSGALSAQVSTIAGTAAHLTLHTSTGALAAQASTVAGAAAHQHAATGALSAQAATVAGTAAHLALHATSGALAADAATVSGAAAHEHASAGALSAQAATVDGTAVHAAAGVHIASGALAAGDASMSGVAEHIGTGESVLSPKFLGSPNVVIRGVKVEEEATDAPPLPAQITNVPDAPPPVKLGRGVTDLLGFAPPVTPLPTETPEVPEIKVVSRKPPTPPEAPAAEAPAVAPAPPSPPPAPVDPVKVVEARLDALNSQLETALSEVAALRAKLDDQVNAQVQVKTVVERVAGDTAAIARREQNRQRAEEITRKLLKDLVEED